MANLSIRNVDKKFGPHGRVEVLKNINLEAQEGEFLVLVGPSGCGKSTLLRMIAGLETPTCGEIRIADRVVNHLSPSERNIAMVFQDYALYPHMTVRENLAFGLKNQKLGKDKIVERIEEASKMLQIGHLLERKPSELSGGQRQRVAIGRAITRQPSLFLFDEPLSNLDAQLRSEMRIEIASIHKRAGATSVYVTHDQVEAMTLATRIAVLNQGIIQQIGAPLELYHTPSNRFVAGFIGNPSMNFLEGDLEVSGTRKVFRVADHTIDMSSALTPEKSGRYVLGIRPESLKPALDGAAPNMQLEAVIVEPYGHENHLIAKLGPYQLISRYSSPERMARYQTVSTGEQIRCVLDLKAVHWFECGSEGRRIASLAGPILDSQSSYSVMTH